MKHALVTGANRGIGLEWARQLVARGDQVFAGARRPARANELHSLRDRAPERCTILELDVADDASVDAAIERIAAEAGALDLLINNAGILPETPGADKLGQLDPTTLQRVLHVNAVAPLAIAQRCLPLLKTVTRWGGGPAVVASLSSGWGSVSRAGAGWPYAYCVSKAALNMGMRIFAGDGAKQGIVAVLLNPGWVRTDMGGPNASVLPEDSVRGMLRVLDGLTAADTGKFLSWRGTEEEW